MDMNEEQIAFYSEIGRSITQWAHVEQALLWVSSACFDGECIERYATASFSIENFRAKLQMADNLMADQYGKTQHMTDWVILRDRLSTVSQARNRLAHYWVLCDQRNKAGRRYMLLPRRMPTQSKPSKKLQKYPGAICLRVRFKMAHYAERAC